MKKVVIVGGGYSGLYALREVIKNKNLKITLIDKHTYHNLQPEVYDFIANKSTFADITIDLNTLSHGFEHDYFEFKNLKVRNIEKEKKEIYTEEGEIVKYDYLILAAGTRTFFPNQIEGLSKASDIKKIFRAMDFKQKFEKELFFKVQNEMKECKKTNIVVVGAGLSGVEIAAEMADKSRNFFKRGGFSCNKLDITLVSSSTTILPGLEPKLVSICHKRLKKLGVNILTNVKLEKMDQEYAYLTNGTKLLQSFLIFTGGVEAVKIKGIEDLEVNHKGQVIVKKTLQTKKYEEIFVIGDLAEIKDEKEEIFPSNVTLTKISGKIAGENVLKLIEGKELSECKPKLEGILIALGGKYAAGNLYGIINIKGRLAYEIKKYVFTSYKKPLLKVLNKGFNKFKKIITSF